VSGAAAPVAGAAAAAYPPSAAVTPARPAGSPPCFRLVFWANSLLMLLHPSCIPSPPAGVCALHGGGGAARLRVHGGHPARGGCCTARWAVLTGQTLDRSNLEQSGLRATSAASRGSVGAQSRGWGTKPAGNLKSRRLRLPPAPPLAQVSAAATAAMLAACATAGNRDLEPHTPALVSCIARPDEVPQVVAKLSATTFVQVGRPPAARARLQQGRTAQRRGGTWAPAAQGGEEGRGGQRSAETLQPARRCAGRCACPRMPSAPLPDPQPNRDGTPRSPHTGAMLRCCVPAALHPRPVLC
jgi:hypothetical protein